MNISNKKWKNKIKDRGVVFYTIARNVDNKCKNEIFYHS